MTNVVERPWGWFEPLGSGEGYLVKRLCIRAGQRISLQRHHHRCEHWVVVGGSGTLLCDTQSHEATPGFSLLIPCGALHRASAGDQDLLIVEVQRGALLSEDDIERIADDYQRVTEGTTAEVLS
jgi:mannose-6-phosphate isomerase